MPRRRSTTPLAVLLAISSLAVGCTATEGGGSSRSPSSTDASGGPSSAALAAPSPPAPAVAPGVPCPDSGDRPFRRMLGTAEVTGLVRGSGRRVVVLSRQSRGTPCDLAALGHALSGAGFRVVSWTAGLDTNQDTLALLVRAERKAGARYVALVGASAGGATSIGAAALIRPALDAVVALSPSSQSELFGDVVPSAARYSGPLMVVVGEGDTAFAGIVPQLESAHQGEESMIVLPGVSQHGKSLVATIDAPVTQAVLDFLAR